MNGLALCAGIGGFDLGLKLAVPGYRSVCYVEREAYPAAILVARMADQVLDEAPLWDDLTSFDGRRWRGRVDIVTAGFPCQPFSCAGKKKRQGDRRWLWTSIRRIIRQARPALVFFENVPGLLGREYCIIKGDFEKLGYRVEPGIFSAAEVGAPYLRRRLFILAARLDSQWQQQPQGTLAEIRQRLGYGFEVTADLDLPGCADAEGGAQLAVREFPGGNDWWHSEPDVARVVSGFPYRVDRVEALGKVAVPLVVAVAYTVLHERLRAVLGHD